MTNINFSERTFLLHNKSSFITPVKGGGNFRAVSLSNQSIHHVVFCFSCSLDLAPSVRGWRSPWWEPLGRLDSIWSTRPCSKATWSPPLSGTRGSSPWLMRISRWWRLIFSRQTVWRLISKSRMLSCPASASQPPSSPGWQATLGPWLLWSVRCKRPGWTGSSPWPPGTQSQTLELSHRTWSDSSCCH